MASLPLTHAKVVLAGLQNGVPAIEFDAGGVVCRFSISEDDAELVVHGLALSVKSVSRHWHRTVPGCCPTLECSASLSSGD